jgi:hypothetical protein
MSVSCGCGRYRWNWTCCGVRPEERLYRERQRSKLSQTGKAIGIVTLVLMAFGIGRCTR